MRRERKKLELLLDFVSQFDSYFRPWQSGGVMVAHEVLVLFVRVRILAGLPISLFLFPIFHPNPYQRTSNSQLSTPNSQLLIPNLVHDRRLGESSDEWFDDLPTELRELLKPARVEVGESIVIESEEV